MATHLKDILLHTLQLDEADWRVKLLQEWPLIVGDLHRRMRIEQITDSLLILGVYDVHWMHELFHMSRLILHKLNHHLGKPHIKKIQFKLVSLRHKKACATKKNVPLQEEKKLVPPRYAQVALQIKDEELRHCVMDFFQKTRGTTR